MKEEMIQIGRSFRLRATDECVRIEEIRMTDGGVRYLFHPPEEFQAYWVTEFNTRCPDPAYASVDDLYLCS